jgi:hypothetical protein
MGIACSRHCVLHIHYAEGAVPPRTLAPWTTENLVPHTPNGSADRALESLIDTLDECVDELERARAKANALREDRRTGRSWEDIVMAEERPLVVESISTVLSSLATIGSSFRREQAAALQGEDVSINRIAAMFGVTRQRISALLREREEAVPASSS